MTALLLAVAVLSANHGKRPDLVVRAGSVTASAGQLTGSVEVRNKGRARARRTSVSLRVGSQVAGSFSLRPVKRGRVRTVRIAAAVPAGLAAGSHPVRVCADATKRVRERREGNNCRRVGTLTVPVDSTPVGPGPSPSPSATPVPTPTSSVPTDPVSYQKNEVLEPGDGRTYWTYVPDAYDGSNQTPIALLVWLHGCGGNSSGDIYTVSPGGDQSYIAITVDGRENGVNGADGCWDVNSDQPKVLDAIANVKTHFNVDPRHVVIGGYSSGGDLAYRTAFYNANTFAGLLAENTAPFRDTGSSQQQSIAAASWKFNVVHLAHTEDGTYAIDTVRGEVGALQDAGFPATLIERPGGHGDETTDPDLRELVLPHMNDDWRSP